MVEKYIIEIPNDDNYPFRGFIGVSGEPVWETGRNPVLYFDKYFLFNSVEDAKNFAKESEDCWKHGYDVLSIANGLVIKIYSSNKN